MALSKLDEMRLQRRQALYGPITTPEEALQYAIAAEQICIDAGPYDPCYGRFKSEQLAYEDIAELLEKQGPNNELTGGALAPSSDQRERG